MEQQAAKRTADAVIAAAVSSEQGLCYGLALAGSGFSSVFVQAYKMGALGWPDQFLFRRSSNMSL